MWYWYSLLHLAFLKIREYIQACYSRFCIQPIIVIHFILCGVLSHIPKVHNGLHMIQKPKKRIVKMKSKVYGIFVCAVSLMSIVACKNIFSENRNSFVVTQEDASTAVEFDDVALTDTLEDANVESVINFDDDEAAVVVGRRNNNVKASRNHRNAVVDNMHSEPKSRIDQRLILSKCLLAEGGWSSRDDWHGIMSVLINRNQTVARWRGAPIEDLARQYCHAIWPNRRTNAWIHNLTWGDMADAPAGWPETMSWDRYRSRWLAIQDFVSDVLDGKVELNNCPATHWGSRTDGAPESWQVANCGRTNNVFYR